MHDVVGDAVLCVAGPVGGGGVFGATGIAFGGGTCGADLAMLNSEQQARTVRLPDQSDQV